MKNAFCLLLVLSTMPTGAFASYLESRTGPMIDPNATRVSLGGGQTLAVSPPRRLTNYAHVEEALYRPNGQDIAYVETQTTGNISTNFLRVIHCSSGKSILRLSTTHPTYGSGSMGTYELVGWSGDGRYLLMVHPQLVKHADGTSAGGSLVTERFDMQHAPYTKHPISLPKESAANSIMSPSPSGRLFLLMPSRSADSGTSLLPFVFLYDPARDTMRRVALPSDVNMLWWQDDAHLLLTQKDAGSYHQVAYDVINGKLTPRTDKIGQVIPSALAFPGVGLSLSEVPVAIPGPSPQSHADGTSLWLNIRGAKPDLSAVCLSKNMAEGGDPSPQLAPDGSSALWAEHGDLYVSTFAVVPATQVEQTGFVSPG